MLGSADLDGLIEGNWDNEMLGEALVDGVSDGISDMLGEALVDGIGDGLIEGDSEGEEVGANSAGRQSSPSNPHSYELYGSESLQIPSPMYSGFDTKQFGYPSTGEGGGQ